MVRARWHHDLDRGVAPLNGPLELPKAQEAIRRGAGDGFHVGAQLSVWMGGRAVTLAEGLAAPGRAMAGDTLLPWYSATKPVTAAAVLQQWERGHLDPDDPVARHVPEFAAAGKDRVTIRHLLTHTAALAAQAGGHDDWESTLTTACAAPLVEGWVPGRRAAYSARLGYHVLGEVVRRVDGRAFDAYVAEELFEPLGMADSWLALPAERHEAYGERMAMMHDTTGSQPEPVGSSAHPERFATVRPSSSGVGPASDLVRFFIALLGKGELDGVRVLSPQTVDTMCARHRTWLKDETFNSVIDWGLGLMVNSWHYERRPAPYGYGDHASPRTFGHGGAQSSVAFADPDAGVAAVVIFNGLAGEAGHHRRTQPVLTALYEDLRLNG